MMSQSGRSKQLTFCHVGHHENPFFPIALLELQQSDCSALQLLPKALVYIQSSTAVSGVSV